MKKPKKINYWDWCETDSVPNGYDLTHEPALSPDNFRILASRHNDLVDLVNLLAEKAGVEFDDEQ